MKPNDLQYIKKTPLKNRKRSKSYCVYKVKSDILEAGSQCCFCFCCCYSVIKLCFILCDPMDCSMLGSPVLHHLLEFAQIHAPCVGDAI